MEVNVVPQADSSLDAHYVLAEQAREEVLKFVARYKPKYYEDLRTIDIRKLVQFIDATAWESVWEELGCPGKADLAEAVTSKARRADRAQKTSTVPASIGKSTINALFARVKQEKKELGGQAAPLPPYNRTIYVCIGNYTKGSLVHEMLHWLTHPDFEKHFTLNPRMSQSGNYKDDLIEGTTEHLTRKVLRVKELRTNVQGKGNFYGPEYETARSVSKHLKKKHIVPSQSKGGTSDDSKSVDDGMANILAKAYFCGDLLALHSVEESYLELKRRQK